MMKTYEALRKRVYEIIYPDGKKLNPLPDGTVQQFTWEQMEDLGIDRYETIDLQDILRAIHKKWGKLDIEINAYMMNISIENEDSGNSIELIELGIAPPLKNRQQSKYEKLLDLLMIMKETYTKPILPIKSILYEGNFFQSGPDSLYSVRYSFRVNNIDYFTIYDEILGIGGLTITHDIFCKDYRLRGKMKPRYYRIFSINKREKFSFVDK